jgi:hypothetical protein
METLMDIVKKNLLSIICGVIALVAIIAAFWPLGSYIAELRQSVAQREATYSLLNSLRTRSRNWPVINLDASQQVALEQFPSQAVIAKGGEMVTNVKKESETILEAARKLNERKLLVPGSLPSPTETERFQFRQAYETAVENLVRDKLNPGTPPTPEEIAAEIQSVWDREFKKQIRIVNNVAINQAQVEENFNERKLLIPNEMRAKVAQTKSIYVNPDALGVAPGISGQSAPEPERIWFAQVLLWVQEDIVNAIAELNDDSAIVSAPVKHLVKLDMPLQYVTGMSNVNQNTEEMSAAVNDINAPLPKNTAVSPTGRVSNALYDVLHFRLTIRVDATRIPDVLQALSRNRYITVLNLKASAVDTAEQAALGFFYGQNVPVVELTIDGEVLQLRQWTVPLMPLAVKRALGIVQQPTMIME